jgi:hypothetical protein
MGTIKDKIQYGINKLSTYYSTTTYNGGDTVDFTGTPATNSNYGLPTTKTSTTSNVLLNIQFPSANDVKDKNFIDYQNRGYTLKGMIKIKATTENILKEGDLITYDNNEVFEVVEWTDRYFPKLDGTYESEYVYSEGLAFKKEIQ